MARGDLHGPKLQLFRVGSGLGLAPDPRIGATTLAGAPLSFALDPDAGAVDRQV